MKRPYDFIRELYRDNLIKIKDDTNFAIGHLDKMIAWIVGFSIAGISLIVSKETNINNLYSSCTVEFIIWLLVISIISGILQRVLLFFYRINFTLAEYYLDAALANDEVMNFYAEDISEEKSIEEVIRRLRVDFGEDHSKKVEYYNQVGEEEKIKVLGDLKNHYMQVREWVINDFKVANNHIKYVYNQAFGIKFNEKEMVVGNHKVKTPKRIKLFGNGAVISFVICVITFISALLILVIWR